MRKLLLAVLIVLLCTSAGFAQGQVVIHKHKTAIPDVIPDDKIYFPGSQYMANVTIAKLFKSVCEIRYCTEEEKALGDGYYVRFEVPSTKQYGRDWYEFYIFHSGKRMYVHMHEGGACGDLSYDGVNWILACFN